MDGYNCSNYETVLASSENSSVVSFLFHKSLNLAQWKPQQINLYASQPHTKKVYDTLIEWPRYVITPLHKDAAFVCLVVAHCCSWKMYYSR